MNLILNFLPMVLLYLIATYSPQVARISHTVLGKVIAIGLILLYAFFDTISGLLVCALVIFYYQTDYVESFSNTAVEDDIQEEGQEEEEEDKQDKKPEDDDKQDKKPDENQGQKDGFTTIKRDEVLIVGEINVPIKPTSHSPSSSSIGEELKDAYPLEPTITIVDDKSTKAFRQKHCSKGHLTHKGQIIKPEMAEHVFPEIKQADFHKCNICDPSCRFDIQMADKLLKVEENLTKPKSSNDFFEVVWQNIQISTSK